MMSMDLERQAERHSDALHRLAAEHQGIVWLALDGRAPDGNNDSELARALSGEPKLAVPLRHPQIDARLQPQWFRLDTTQSGGSALLRLSLEAALEEAAPQALRTGGGRGVAGWLLLPSATDPPAVASRVGQHMIQRHDGHDILLRLHDPAVLWWAWRLMNDAQRAWLLAGADAWCLLSPKGELETLAATAAREHSALNLTMRQWQHLLDIGALNQALRTQPEWSAARDDWRLLLQATVRARHHGLSAQDDIALFACHAVQVHSCFDHHPMLQELLGHRAADESYAALVADLDDATWQRIQRDCLAMTPPAT
jgi:hypothetical protein